MSTKNNIAEINPEGRPAQKITAELKKPSRTYRYQQSILNKILDIVNSTPFKKIFPNVP